MDPVATPMTFAQARTILMEHGKKFGDKGVTGVGVANRENALRFVVSVNDAQVQEQLKSKYAGRCIEGLPIHVELGQVRALHGSVAHMVRPPFRGWKAELLDRPGYLIVAAIIVIAGGWALASLS